MYKMYICSDLLLRIVLLNPGGIYPEKVPYKAIGVEMKGMESSMKLVALGATQRKG